ncbi:MAG: hypothetical protein ACK40N_10560 [Meiothermus ruber]|jgi:ABC-type uncharacterized transport system auxiliary subunit|uniref:hypothetical protein n=1 Tax=Meiothermus ruber TaxID=277 RepID=UPI003919D01D
MQTAKVYALLTLTALLCACAPNALRPATFNLTVDNSRCQGTYRTVFVYRNNIILGQVQGEPRIFLSLPAGSADFKATPVLGNSPALFKTIRLEKDEVWRLCG